MNGPEIEIVPPDRPSELHVPRRDATDAVERHLAAANDRAACEATRILDQLLPGHDFDRMGRTVDGGRFGVHEGAIVHRAIDGERLLDELLRTDAGGDRVKVVRETVRPSTTRFLDVGSPPSAFVHLRPGGVATLMDEGHSLVVDGACFRSPEVAELALLFERALGWRVNVNVYVGRSSTDAFGFHWDDHEVVIVPLAGAKQWEVGEPTDLSPVRELHPKPDAEVDPVWVDDLVPGTSAHIPRGWPHRVRAHGELTVHLTVSVTRPVLSTSVPVFPRSTDRSRLDPALLREPGRVLHEVVDATAAGRSTALDAGVRMIAAKERYEVAARRMAGLSTHLHLDPGTARVRSPYGGGWLVGPAPTPDQVQVGAGNRRWLLPRDQAELVADLPGVRPEPLTELGPLEVLSAMVEVGIVDVVPAGFEPWWIALAGERYDDGAHVPGRDAQGSGGNRP